jgi:hypothetical protein
VSEPQRFCIAPVFDTNLIVIRLLEAAQLLLKDPVIAKSCAAPENAVQSGYMAVSYQLSSIAINEKCTAWFKTIVQYDREFTEAYDTFTRNYANFIHCTRVFDALEVLKVSGLVEDRKELARRALKDSHYDFSQLNDGTSTDGLKRYMEQIAIGEA